MQVPKKLNLKVRDRPSQLSINDDRIDGESDNDSIDTAAELDERGDNCLTAQHQQQLDEEELCEMLAGKHRFQDVGKILHVGIIDYLTTFSCMKRIELRAKSMTAEKRKNNSYLWGTPGGQGQA